MVGYFGGTQYSSSFLNFLQQYGVLDVILPFVLFFAIIYSVLHKTNVVTDKKNIQVIISLCLSLLIVIPHMMMAVGKLPAGYGRFDVVELMYKILPEVGIVILGVLLLLIIIGVFFSKVEFGGTGLGAIMTVFAILIVIGIFVVNILKVNGQSIITKYPFWERILTPQNQAILIIVIVFAVVVAWVTSEPNKDWGKNAWGGFKDFFSEIGRNK